jgi:hypothetical protein
MQTTLFEVIFYDGRKFNIFCKGKKEHNNFWLCYKKLENEIEHIIESVNGIHTVKQFEQININNLKL